MSEVKKRIRPRLYNPNYIQEVLDRYKGRTVKFLVRERDVSFFSDKCFDYLNTERDDLSAEVHTQLVNLLIMISAVQSSSSTIKLEKENLSTLSGVEKSDFLVKYFTELKQLLSYFDYTDTMRSMDIYQIIVICKIPIKIVGKWMELCEKQAAEENKDISTL